MGTDSLYYIMDYSGNYYRTNQADQLIAVAGEQNATVFTFAQANSRICVGKKASFYCMVPIGEKADDMNDEESKCDEINDISSTFSVEEQEKIADDEFVSPIKELTYDELSEPVEKNAASYDLSEMDWTEYLTHFTFLVEGLKDYRQELSKKHSDIDQKICDILHYIELCETDEKEAVDLVELLRVCRENRRDVKDELQRIEYFQNNFGTNANLAKAKQALKCIKGLETRKYTPFDGKENDWVSFAKQQAEFYRNAEQYITNLQMDIKEIDDEIEDILLETEDANCNVAQGYKVFKRLKELRIEKKAKTKELNCLYILTDYIDCESLADTCDDNLAEVEEIMGVQDHNEVTKMQPIDHEQEEKMHIVENIKDMVG